MQKMAERSKVRFDCAIRKSLSTIKVAHVQLALLTGTSATEALLASQIELYDVLLDQISGIHSSLAGDLKYTRLTPYGSSPRGLNS